MLQFPGSPGIDLAVLGESWCAPCSALREASSIDPRDCRAVIVVENFAAWRQSVRDLGSLALFLYVDGVMSGEREDCLGALLALCPAGFPAFAWNDLDAAGFSRFDALARDYPSLRPLLMDCETLAAMPDSRLRPMGDNRKAVLREYLDANPSSRFAPAGRALLSRGRFLEQEALLATRSGSSDSCWADCRALMEARQWARMSEEAAVSGCGGSTDERGRTWPNTR